MSIIKKHFKKTERLIRAIDKKAIANWILSEGYFPEQYVLPPSFSVTEFKLEKRPINKNLKDLPRRNLITISYPKSLLTSRVFGIQHPSNYHDIVFYMMSDWEAILNHLFHKDLRIYSYSIPIPVNSNEIGTMSSLRSGRMIYEWIEMAEKDMVAEAYKFNLIIRTDITNFYNSLYTHSIGWALHGREDALADKDIVLIGNKIDKLVQYANDGRTNGIPVGSALSDLIAEIVISSLDLKVSKRLKGIEFVGSRFKDDYRILCNSETDAKAILKAISDELICFNLLINESKTKVLTLPNGLYRQHDREYYPYSLRGRKKIFFKTFELTLLKVLDIHNLFPGTSILEKFLSELFSDSNEFKVEFSHESSTRKKQIFKTMSLLILLKRQSEKTICQVLAIFEALYYKYGTIVFKEQLRKLVETEIIKASQKKSVFELVWLIFFSRYIGLGITNFSELMGKEDIDNFFLKSILSSQQKFFTDYKTELFRKPKDCRNVKLAKRLAVFDRTKE